MKDTPADTRQKVTPPVEPIPRQLDPPPFFLDGEIRVGGSKSALSAVALGILILLLYPVLFDEPRQALPPMSLLLVAALVAASFYLGVRFLAYWVIWLRAIGRHSYTNGIHPAARGELPRNAFLVVLLAPLASFLLIGVLIWAIGIRLWPEFWLAVAVAFSISVADLKAALHVARLDSGCWIKENRHGIDVLRPIDLP